MKANRRSTLAGVASLAIATAFPALAVDNGNASGFAGSYLGTLHVGTASLRLRLDISDRGEASMSSIDQGNVPFAVEIEKIDGADIVIKAPIIQATYSAKLTSDGALEGIFSQLGQNIPLSMKRSAVASARPRLGAMSLDTLRALRLELGAPALGAAWDFYHPAPSILVDGLRSASADESIRDGDSWHIGSITKSMTALLAARAVEAGNISWDSKVADILGHAISDIHAGYADVNLLHLLSHRSGLSAGAGEAALSGYPLLLSDDIQAQRLKFAGSVLAVPPAAPPAAKMAYANAGYVIAGAMLETVTKRPWEQLIRQHVFGPLHLHSAGIGLPDRKGRLDQPVGHKIDSEGKRIPHLVDLPAVLGPAGMTHLSLADLLRYLSAHRDREARILRQENWEKLHSPPFGGSYALGWFVLPDGTLMHNGSNQSWYALAMFNRNSGSVSAFTANDASPLADESRIYASMIAASKD